MTVIGVLLVLAAQTASLEQGQLELDAFNYETARRLLERAVDEGPYALDDHIQLYESLGVVYASLDQRDEALKAFDMLLALSPGHVLPYSLSPKVTLPFEEARSQSGLEDQIRLEVRWPRDRSVDEPVSVDLELASDPYKLVVDAVVYARRRGDPGYREHQIELAEVGTTRRLQLPPVAAGAEQAEAMEFYIVARDRRGNEVHKWYSDARPREVPLLYEPPTPWYLEWWVWAISGTVAVVGTSALVGMLIYEPPSEIPASAGVVWR